MGDYCPGVLSGGYCPGGGGVEVNGHWDIVQRDIVLWNYCIREGFHG